MTLANINWPTILAGLGLFLFGIKYMGDGLKSYSGDKLKRIIEKCTSSHLKGILIGAFITCLIQSSSGTTALAIGLIRSGLMTFNQSMGIIMGANIGTVITSVFVGLNISQYSVYFIIFGAIFLLFSKNKKTNYLGQVILGFGCLFYGLDVMSENLSNIAQVPEFIQIANYLSQNPLLALIGGVVLTATIQSSSAMIAIVQQMYAIKAINISVALPFLFGSNIGTTITAILASIGGTIDAKRAAFFHVLFNITGAIIFMFLLTPFTYFIEQLAISFNISASLQLSIAHLLFNIITTVIVYPLIPVVFKLVNKLITSKKPALQINLSELDSNVVNLFPSHALAISKNKTIEMANITLETIKSIKSYFQSKNMEIKENVYELEEMINTFDQKITDYLILINHETLNDQESNEYIINMKTVKDFERIGDLCINILKYFEAIYDEKEDFSHEARIDLETMINLDIDMLEHAIFAYQQADYDTINYVNEKETTLDYFNKKAKLRHIKRVGSGHESSPLVNSTYVDILANLERIGDHCQNIAQANYLDDLA
ncbi:Na/Pi cotransporter family protein [uncultured Thomasclavelia sp.]|uniref:Na/Pi cotransporter family protein n=1 Tax=uncultured Thomasclavelia sp. TaxID=3025759 RepID=UPI0025D64CF0|nr:Na/Pi cotransporter family protein [uncultured Thomasclavelia sp.]